jgi:hypothetical protein
MFSSSSCGWAHGLYSSNLPVWYPCVSEWHGYIWVPMVSMELCLWLMLQIGLFGCCGNQVTVWLGWHSTTRWQACLWLWCSLVYAWCQRLVFLVCMVTVFWRNSTWMLGLPVIWFTHGWWWLWYQVIIILPPLLVATVMTIIRSDSDCWSSWIFICLCFLFSFVYLSSSGPWFPQ